LKAAARTPHPAGKSKAKAKSEPKQKAAPKKRAGEGEPQQLLANVLNRCFPKAAWVIYKKNRTDFEIFSVQTRCFDSVLPIVTLHCRVPHAFGRGPLAKERQNKPQRSHARKKHCIFWKATVSTQ
jgi:hypothetical protein